MTTAAALVTSAKAILLDFDGPVTALMPWPRNAQTADAARRPLLHAGLELPESVAATTDHLAVLHYAAPLGLELLAAVEDACVGAEIDAAAVSQPTPGAHEFLSACQGADKPVVIVSNNAADAVHTYLNRFRLHALVRGVVGRQPHRPDLMKPHPSYVLAALDLAQAEPQDAVLIGDSITDVEVSRATGTRAIGYAKTPERGLELAAAGADATTDSMSSLAESASASPW